jgi:hypothetical protein
MTGDISGSVDDWFAVGEDCAKITLDTTQDLRYYRVRQANTETRRTTMTGHKAFTVWVRKSTSETLEAFVEVALERGRFRAAEIADAEVVDRRLWK